MVPSVQCCPYYFSGPETEENSPQVPTYSAFRALVCENFSDREEVYTDKVGTLPLAYFTTRLLASIYLDLGFEPLIFQH